MPGPFTGRGNVRAEVSASLAPYAEELCNLIDEGFAGIDAADIEVHVRARPPRVRFVVRYPAPIGAPGATHRTEAHPDAPAVTSLVLSRHSDARRLAHQHGGVVERTVDTRLAERMSGSAYYSLPDMARVQPGTRYLVTLRIPLRLDDLPYPVTLQYRRGDHVLATAPAIGVRDWQEELVHLVAHEARHCEQFRLVVAKSEIDAERWAQRAVLRFRAARAVHPNT